MMLTECPVCAGEVKRIVAPREIPVGRDRVTVPLEYQVCQKCGEEFVDPDTFALAQREAAAAVRDKKDLLSPEDILRIRVEAGLTQASTRRGSNWGRRLLVGGSAAQSVRAERPASSCGSMQRTRSCSLTGSGPS